MHLEEVDPQEAIRVPGRETDAPGKVSLASYGI